MPKIDAGLCFLRLRAYPAAPQNSSRFHLAYAYRALAVLPCLLLPSCHGIAEAREHRRAFHADDACFIRFADDALGTFSSRSRRYLHAVISKTSHTAFKRPNSGFAEGFSTTGIIS